MIVLPEAQASSDGSGDVFVLDAETLTSSTSRIVLETGTYFLFEPSFGELPSPVRFCGSVWPAPEGSGLTSTPATTPEYLESAYRIVSSYQPEDFFIIEGVLSQPGTYELLVTSGDAYILFSESGGSTEKGGFKDWLLEIVVEDPGSGDEEPIAITSDPPSEAIVEQTELQYTVESDVADVTVDASSQGGDVWMDGDTVHMIFPSPGEYEITVTVSKSGYTAATQTFTVEVVEELVFASPPVFIQSAEATQRD